MPTVPFNADATVDEKRETTGELTIVSAEIFTPTPSAKPEAIVRPLRRREPSDEDNRTPDLEDLEAQIINKLTKLERPQKAQRERESIEAKKPLFRWNPSRESKKSSRDVSDLVWKKLCCPFPVIVDRYRVESFELRGENGKINRQTNYFKQLSYYSSLISI